METYIVFCLCCAWTKYHNSFSTGNIYHWKREYPTCVTKVPKYKYWNFGGFLVYNFMKLWDGVRLPPINTLSTSLKMEFLADILTSRANECFDSLPEDLQYIVKELGRM